jgi:hypothetical protein
MRMQEEHTKIVEYAQNYLRLEEIGPHSTDEEIVNAINNLRRDYNQSKINLQGVKRRADATRIYEETGYLTDSSEGEPFDDDIDHIVTLHLRQMSDEQKAIYASEYEIDVDTVEEYWNSKHEKRVNYAQRYASDVTFEDSPSEVLDRVNQERQEIITTLYELDAKANIFDRVGEENYHSDEDDRQRQEIMQHINTFPRSDILAPRNSRTWKQAQEYYESLRRRPNE